MLKRIFDDYIINESLYINELPLFTIVSICESPNVKLANYWNSLTESQLYSIYNTLVNTNSIILELYISRVTYILPEK